MIVCTAVTWRVDWRDAVSSERSATCRDRVQFFGCPYGVKSIAYGTEVRRVGKTCAPIGCLHQHSELPMIVWYPEGNWMEVCDGMAEV